MCKGYYTQNAQEKQTAHPPLTATPSLFRNHRYDKIGAAAFMEAGNSTIGENAKLTGVSMYRPGRKDSGFTR